MNAEQEVQETTACQIVQVVTSEAYVAYDDGTLASMVDFVTPNLAERLRCLEVTSNISNELRHFNANRRKLEPWTTHTGDGLWFVRTAHTDSRKLACLKKDIDTLLGPLAALNVDGCLFDNKRMSSASSDQALARACLEAVFRFRQMGCSDAVVVQPTLRGGFVGAADVTAEVEVELNKADNLAKLRTWESEGVPGELFVWLVDSDGEAALVSDSAMRDSGNRTGSPGPAPTLPPGVSRVWAAAGYHEKRHLARAVWYSESGNWEAVDTLKLAISTPKSPLAFQPLKSIWRLASGIARPLIRALHARYRRVM